MDDSQVGSVIRAVRIRRGLRQADVAALAGVSQAAVSAIESGRIERTTIHALRRVAGAVGVSVALTPRWRGAETAKLLDERHAALVRAVVARLGAIGWDARTEPTFNIRGERGAIDVLAWHPVARVVLVIEVKTVICDLQDLLSTMDRKRRLAPIVARDLGWRPLVVASVLVLPDETQARHAVARYETIFRVSLPARGPEVRAWLKAPDRELRGVWFLLNASPDDAKRRFRGSMRVRRRTGQQSRSAARSNRSDTEGSGAVRRGPERAASI